MSIKLLLGQVVIELGLDACLVGHMLKGFLHQLQQPVLFFKRHDEAVMDSEDRRVGPHEVSNDIFADAAVDVHQLQDIINEIQEAEVTKNEDKNRTSSLLNQVEQIIDQRLDELTPEQVKNIIQDMIRKHLGWLVVWGGAVGGFIGFGVAII